MKLAEKKVVVVGLGKTGMATARFLKKRGAVVVVSDAATESKLGAAVQTLRKMGVGLELGQHRLPTFMDAQLIVISPGVSHTIAPVQQARTHGIPVLGEIELASRFITQPIVAVTGTNGKTTTTELVGRMLRGSQMDVFVGGNIGNPLIGYVDEPQTAEVIVAELSSFQLDTICTFRPAVGVLLNITADHLDRYPNFEAYAASKMRLFENQQPEDIAILNSSDRRVDSLAQNIRSQKWIYPNAAVDQQGAALNDQHIFLHAGQPVLRQDTIGGRRSANTANWSLDITRIKLRGRHNLENACAASLAALAAGAQLQAVREALEHFGGLPHRLEYVATVEGIEYFNDSKATNVDAVIQALACFAGPVVLIMGGLDKGSDFEALKNVTRQSVKELIVMGDAAGRIRSALGSQTLTTAAASMAEALDNAYRAAAPGDVVLLSPGCASFDMYANYARRGEDFSRQVARLQETAGGKK
jgi:UDP-N-acetylmuramoylalanine--D-glutamate ligase